MHYEESEAKVMNEKDNKVLLNTSLNKGEIVLYQPNDNIKLEVRLDNETVWLTQQQIADLFGVKQPAISKHIANIYKSGELDENGTYSILEYMDKDGICMIQELNQNTTAQKIRVV